MRALIAFALVVTSLLMMVSCGGGGGGGSTTVTPVTYNPNLRYPEMVDYNKYYDPDYREYKRISSRITSKNSIWEEYDSISGEGYLTPIGVHREELRNWGANWLNLHPKAHVSAAPGALVLPAAGYLFTDGPVQSNLEGSTTVTLNTSNGGQAFVVYALKDIPEGYCVTQVAVLGQWTYVGVDATGGMNLGLSCFSETENEFTGYYLSGDLYHPDHWIFDCAYGVTPSYEGAMYLVVLVHDGLEARIDGVTVTIEQQEGLVEF